MLLASGVLSIRTLIPPTPIGEGHFTFRRGFLALHPIAVRLKPTDRGAAILPHPNSWEREFFKGPPLRTNRQIGPSDGYRKV